MRAKANLPFTTSFRRICGRVAQARLIILIFYRLISNSHQLRFRVASQERLFNDSRRDEVTILGDFCLIDRRNPAL
jgi:hypothetical protein